MFDYTYSDLFGLLVCSVPEKEPTVEMIEMLSFFVQYKLIGFIKLKLISRLCRRERITKTRFFVLHDEIKAEKIANVFSELPKYGFEFIDHKFIITVRCPEEVPSELIMRIPGPVVIIARQIAETLGNNPKKLVENIRKIISMADRPGVVEEVLGNRVRTEEICG